MQTKQVMGFLKAERIQGVSKKTGNSFDFTMYHFLDSNFEVVIITAVRGYTPDLSNLKPMTQVECLLVITFDNNNNPKIQLGSITQVK